PPCQESRVVLSWTLLLWALPQHPVLQLRQRVEGNAPCLIFGKTHFLADLSQRAPFTEAQMHHALRSLVQRRQTLAQQLLLFAPQRLGFRLRVQGQQLVLVTAELLLPPHVARGRF